MLESKCECYDLVKGIFIKDNDSETCVKINARIPTITHAHDNENEIVLMCFECCCTAYSM